MTVKRGFHFLHASWKKPDVTAAQMRELPATQTAQEFVVTKVVAGCVYYRPIYREGGEVTRGTAMTESVEKFPSRVLCWCDEDGVPKEAAA